MMQFFSQHSEDRWIAEHLELPEKGVFCEVGAYDGSEASNTGHFELKGWTGICIEPNPNVWRDLLHFRSCDKFFGAVAKQYGQIDFDVSPIPTHSGVNRGGQRVRVPALPLATILDAYGFSPLDLLSIDTEGTELDVWESGGFGRLHPYPRVVIIEWETHGLPSNAENIRRQFAELPYKQVHQTVGNLIFQRTDKAEGE